MKTSLSLICLIMVLGCGAGYKRVKYSEMPMPPTITLIGNELIVTTNNKDGGGLSVYKVDINIRELARNIELKGYQALAKPEKTQFIITVSEAQRKKIRNYRVYWIDPGGKKTRVEIITA